MSDLQIGDQVQTGMNCLKLVAYKTTGIMLLLITSYCEAFSVVDTDCLQGNYTNYTGYDLSWVTSIRTLMNTNKSPSFQKFEQFIYNNNNTQLQV